MKTKVLVKRVYEGAAAKDGYRVLVDRLWPRGIRKTDLPYDLWAKELTPSPDLRNWFHQDTSRWPVFVQRYRAELAANPAVPALLQQFRTCKTITLLYASADPEHNHALVLQEFLQEAMGGGGSF